MKAVVMDAEWAPRKGYELASDESPGGLARQACGVYKNPVFSVQTMQDPSPAPGEVVIKVGACGVCGSDTHCYETDDAGYVLFSGPVQMPCICGHEFAGEVVAVGSGVRTIKMGQLVVSEGMLYCGVCEPCKKGFPNQCEHLDMLGFSAPGAYAEYVSIHEKHLWSIEGIAEHLGTRRAALEMGALIEPLSCPYNGIWVMGDGMDPGSHIAVYGCGPIGLGAIMLCRAAGAAKIIAFDVVEERRQLALQCGADEAYDPIELQKQGIRPSSLVREMTNGWGADIQIEAAGAGHVTMPEIDLSWAPRGTMIYLGRSGKKAPVELDRMVSGANKIVGSRGHAGGGCFPNIIRLMECGVLDPMPVVSARMGLMDAVAALERSTSRKDGKIMLLAD